MAIGTRSARTVSFDKWAVLAFVIFAAFDAYRGSVAALAAVIILLTVIALRDTVVLVGKCFNEYIAESSECVNFVNVACVCGDQDDLRKIFAFVF